MPRPTIARSIKRRRLRELGNDAAEAGQPTPNSEGVTDEVHDNKPARKKKSAKRSRVARSVIGALSALLLGIVAAPYVEAAGLTPTVRWTPSLENTDGTTFTLADITAYTVLYRPEKANIAWVKVAITPPSTSYAFKAGDLSCGNYEMSVTEKTSSDSIPSPTIIYNMGVPCRPKPPTGVTVT